MLRDCVASLLQQTWGELEFLFVLDGVADPGRGQLEAEARRDGRIRILCNNRHGGVSAARNRGLEAARGEWVGFVDADDRVEPAMVEKLVTLARDRECGLTGCGFAREKPDGSVWVDAPAAGVMALNADRDGARAFASAQTSCCNKLFSRVRLGTLRFREDLINLEDAVFLTQALRRSRRAGFLPEPLYRVRYRAESAHRRRIGWSEFEPRYRALAVLAELGAEESRGTRWMKRLWAWRLLEWSLATRRYLDELPADCRADALPVVRRFYEESLAPFHPSYPAWLHVMLKRRLRDVRRLFEGPDWYYTLLWNRIRVGLAPFGSSPRRQWARGIRRRLAGAG